VHDNQDGYILVLAMIIVVAALSVIAIKTALSSLTLFTVEDVSLDRMAVTAAGESCMEDALIRLYWDNGYTGGITTIDGITCETTVSGGGGNRTVSVNAIIGDFSYELESLVNLSPFRIDSWDND